MHNEIQISMHRCRSLMSDAPQGAFVVIPEISLSDISYIIKKPLLLTPRAGRLILSSKPKIVNSEAARLLLDSILTYFRHRGKK